MAAKGVGRTRFTEAMDKRMLLWVLAKAKSATEAEDLRPAGNRLWKDAVATGQFPDKTYASLQTHWSRYLGPLLDTQAGQDRLADLLSPQQMRDLLRCLKGPDRRSKPPRLGLDLADDAHDEFIDQPDISDEGDEDQLDEVRKALKEEPSDSFHKAAGQAQEEEDQGEEEEEEAAQNQEEVEEAAEDEPGVEKEPSEAALSRTQSAASPDLKRLPSDSSRSPFARKAKRSKTEDKVVKKRPKEAAKDGAVVDDSWEEFIFGQAHSAR